MLCMAQSSRSEGARGRSYVGGEDAARNLEQSSVSNQLRNLPGEHSRPARRRQPDEWTVEVQLAVYVSGRAAGETVNLLLNPSRSSPHR